MKAKCGGNPWEAKYGASRHILLPVTQVLFGLRPEGAFRIICFTSTSAYYRSQTILSRDCCARAVLAWLECASDENTVKISMSRPGGSVVVFGRRICCHNIHHRAIFNNCRGQLLKEVFFPGSARRRRDSNMRESVHTWPEEGRHIPAVTNGGSLRLSGQARLIRQHLFSQRGEA